MSWRTCWTTRPLAVDVAIAVDHFDARDLSPSDLEEKPSQHMLTASGCS